MTSQPTNTPAVCISSASNSVLDKRVGVIIHNMGDNGISIPVTFHTMLVMLGRVPSIHFLLDYAAGFAPLCAVMNHPKGARGLAADQCARAISEHSDLERRNPLPVVSGETFVMTYKAEHARSQHDAIEIGTRQLVNLFAVAGAKGIRKATRALCYLDNVAPCRFNEGIHEAVESAVLNAIAYYCHEVKEFDAHLNKIAGGYCCEYDVCDKPSLIPLDCVGGVA